jgi:SAM-dependent methyltransferase
VQITTPEALRASYERIWTTTDMRESADYYARCLDLAGARAGQRVLDIACGGGYLLMEAERRGMVTSGIDIADAALAKARKIAPRSELRQGDAEALPYADGAFDVVTCLGSLEHFLRPEIALEEMRRVLAQGGRAIVVVPNQWFGYDVARGWIEGAGLWHGQESERYYSIAQARGLIGQAFWVRHSEGWNPPPALAQSTRPFTGRWRGAALRVYGWLRTRLPIAMAYVFVFVGSHAPDEAPVEVRPATDAVIPGGWHEREDTFARWTAARAGVWVRLGNSVRALVRGGEPGSAPLGITIAVERQIIGHGSAPAGEWVEIAADVPPALRGTVQRVYLAPEHTWSPAARGDSTDVRDLGVSVQRIWSI